jgi:hypothetical protein
MLVSFVLTSRSKGYTVILNRVESFAGQRSLLALTITAILAMIGESPIFVAINAGILPLPLLPNPIDLSQVQVNDESGEALLKMIPFTTSPLQNEVSLTAEITGVGFTVTTTESRVSQSGLADNVK